MNTTIYLFAGDLRDVRRDTVVAIPGQGGRLYPLQKLNDPTLAVQRVRIYKHSIEGYLFYRLPIDPETEKALDAEPDIVRVGETTMLELKPFEQ